jgi:hypothetical protein
MRAAPLLFVFAGCTPAESADHADFGGEILAVRVEVDAGSVTVRATENAVVQVDRVLRGAAALTESRRVVDGILRIEARCESLLPCGADVAIVVPHGLPVDVRTGSGDVHVDGVDSDLSIEVGDGDIFATALLSETVRVQAGWGNATLSFDEVPNDVAVGLGVGDVVLRVPAGGYQLDVEGLGEHRVDGLADDPAGPRLHVRTSSGQALLASR